MITYKAKGVHTNRKGGKSRRKPVNRSGKAAKKAPAKTAASPAKKTGPTLREKVGVASEAAADMSETMAAGQDKFSAEHAAAVQSGAALQQRNMSGGPSRAAEIIKRRRI